MCVFISILGLLSFIINLFFVRGYTIKLEIVKYNKQHK